MTQIKEWTVTQKRINEINDRKMHNAIQSFIDNKCIDTHYSKSAGIRYYYSALPLIFKNYVLDDLDWEDFQDIVEKNLDEIKKISDFLVFLVDENLYKGFNKAKIIDLKRFLCGEVNNNYSAQLFSKNENIEYFYIKETHKYYKLLRIPVANIFLRKLIKDFLMQCSHSPAIADKTFCNRFTESIGTKEINSLRDINYGLFELQFSYYNDNDKDGRSIKTLTGFYLFLLSLPGGENIFREDDPVDKFFLYRNKFTMEYSNGFRVVRYNNLDKVPNYDKWILYPTDFITKSNMMNGSDSAAIDFTMVKDKEKREILKKFFWHNAKCLKTDIQFSKSIARFLNFLGEHEKSKIVLFSSQKRTFDISGDSIALYRNSLLANGDANMPRTIASKMRILVLFLDYLKKNKLVTIDPACYTFLKTKRYVRKNNSKPLLDEDVKRVLIALNQKAQNGGLEQYIYYSMAYLQVFTEMRASHIRAIKVSEIKTDLKNLHSLITPSKTSGGKPSKVQITTKTYQLLNDIILRTQDCRDMCKDPEIRELLFIHKGKRNIYRNISDVAYAKNLKMTAKEIGIDCSPENLRDTYMTKAMEAKIAGKISGIDRGSITGHASTRTDDAHYAKASIKQILQAAYKIIIGNIDVNGNIIESVAAELNIPQNQVSNQCGLCSAKTCTLQSNLDCLMCRHFVTSVEFIGAFKSEISRLDNMITAELLLHEKEHLHQIKKLCVAYLEKILIISGAIVYES